MVLLSIGILIASLSFFAFKIPPSRWRQYVASWISSPAVRAGAAKNPSPDRTAESTERTSQAMSPTASPSNVPHDSHSMPKTLLEAQGTDQEIPSSMPDEPVEQLSAATEPDLSPRLVISSSCTAPSIMPVSEGRPSHSAVDPVDAPSRTASCLPQTRTGARPAMLPPLKPATASLMPPPGVRPSALRPLPTTTSSLNPPPSAASSLRGSRNQSIGALKVAASSSTLPPASRPTRKVQLEPGHSPLDWASLIKDPSNSQYLRGKDLPPHLIKVPPSRLKVYNGRKGADAWGAYQGKIYNLTPYLKFHPGGVGELMRGAGKVGEAERLFLEIHPWVNWDGMLAECLVGILVGEGEGGPSYEKDMNEVD